MFLGFGSPLFGNSIYSLYQPVILDFEFTSPLIKNIPLFLTLFGIGSAFVLLKLNLGSETHSSILFTDNPRSNSNSLTS